MQSQMGSFPVKRGDRTHKISRLGSGQDGLAGPQGPLRRMCHRRQMQCLPISLEHGVLHPLPCAAIVSGQCEGVRWLSKTVALARVRHSPIRRRCSSTARDVQESSKWFQPSRWRRSATCRLRIRPGVAVPVLAIAENEDCAFDYTTKGNFVAVITNGTAILGLGNRGALAAKPVMEGKAVLFKRFADIDSIDLEVPPRIRTSSSIASSYLGKSWGGINLEDIRAPECFVIEQRLRELLDIPVFHDDQHGTAIIAAAGLINALQLTGRDIKNDQARMQWRRCCGNRQSGSLKAIGFTPNKSSSANQRRDLPGPHRRHEPMELRARGKYVSPNAGAKRSPARRFLRPLGQGSGEQGNGQVHGGQADHFRYGQS